ncbi:hypothetical protein [Nonomuraea sp. B19D2]|uniref:hypothetical protein n=1 Tax=Nonomuraea sp. B19D2 TaxID=3159561 RepID=UPI0032DB0DF9
MRVAHEPSLASNLARFIPFYAREGHQPQITVSGCRTEEAWRGSPGLLAEQPYRASAKFRCGGKDGMIDIYLSRIAKGRDAMSDLIELMRIAQKRYGRLYGCTPGS